MVKNQFLKIKALLVEKQLRQEQLADLAKMDKTTLNRKLNGHTEFTLTEIDRISKALDIEAMRIPHYFFN